VRKIPERLLDIQEAIERIMKYTRDGRYRYDHDPEIKWTEIIGMRTILAHRYFDTDPDALWAAVNQDLQDLKRSIDAILDEEEK
jgi:uncharacterized protein with HEPN domain